MLHDNISMDGESKVCSSGRCNTRYSTVLLQRSLPYFPFFLEDVIPRHSVKVLLNFEEFKSRNFVLIICTSPFLLL